MHNLREYGSIQYISEKSEMYQIGQIKVNY